jgi:glyoxylase-like metal-dependent hydrolase (beta-lactamase superfamily II)
MSSLDEMLAPMSLHRDVAPGVHRIQDGPVNWYLAEADDGVLAIDAGLPSSWTSLRHALGAIGRPYADLRALVLTHAHFDHVGFARRAQAELELPVFCGPGDQPLAAHPMKGKSERPRLLYAWRPTTAMLLARMVGAGVLWAPRLEGLHALEPGEVLDGLPGRPRVVAVPGHTLGSVAFHFQDRDTVITGDALVTRDPYTGAVGPRLVARAATGDVALARTSLDAIAATHAQIVLPGHGEPWREGAARAAELAQMARIV